MIIISQDKERIVNFNNIEDVWIDESNEEKGTYEVLASSKYGYNWLATYKTKDRAKEVLQEISEVASIKGCKRYKRRNRTDVECKENDEV